MVLRKTSSPESMAHAISILYLGCLAGLTLYGAHRVALLRRLRSGVAAPHPELGQGERPRVTVQLPLFNERAVARRLIRVVGQLRWPAARLEIQVLDDSTDETRGIVDSEVARLRAAGIDARVLRRPDRRGFKAGALARGLEVAKGELLCIFDADFMPGASFLEDTVGAFGDPAVGMVQARWGHSNRGDSALTRAQATLLDGHLVVEHQARSGSGLFFNFNGTAGLWRRDAIVAAGGWQHDTLTEDLDISYRAQLAGWRFVYLPDVEAPAELPADISSFLSQQRRWAKGSVQVARKLLTRVLRADQPWRVKLEAVAHLTGNVGYPLLLMVLVLTPLVGARPGLPWHLAHLAAFLACTVSVFTFYERSQHAVGRTPLQRLFDVPRAVMLGIGMSVSQTRAVLSGVFGGTGSFVRTPKRGGGRRVAYRSHSSGQPAVELVLTAWFGWAIVEAVRFERWGSVPFLALFFSGVAWVGGLALVHRWSDRDGRGARAAPIRSDRPPEPETDAV